MLSLLTAQEVEMLANLLSRAGVNKFEVIWANGVMDRLRALAEANKEEPENEQPADQSGV